MFTDQFPLTNSTTLTHSTLLGNYWTALSGSRESANLIVGGAICYNLINAEQFFNPNISNNQTNLKKTQQNTNSCSTINHDNPQLIN